MKKIISLLLVGCFLASSATLAIAKEAKKGERYGLVVILDPGHGGMDPGAHGIFNDKMVVEDEYVYDVSLRLQRILLVKEAIVFMTIKDKK
ncbi:MAG: hypothetical protein A2271_01640 [Candidatus Moranbacteria bacterium RIFOXYA12_FULL_35_19]|nr:MAG: N-acetylmuramoyl-L-alanine amidase [Candidatus Moranbacteria bacterium GW2011_GWF2_35_39]OGI32893.1 MAG: hypothetical protein A2489_00540 [Candidatus Moranbacteria bacterium RIFOXYC12_FULL_36_13]OGI35987.1 MAG: hypothetical protein A2271_01640 [Candidatus Moranbacteria bacterium RIFOXYA12_FULL_35_19]